VYVYDKDKQLVGHQTTGADGHYKFVLPEGTYTVVIERPFVNESTGNIEVNDDSVINGTGDPDITVTGDSYTISGYVTDAEGAPIEGATVYLYNAETNERIDETSTDSTGYYEFSGLPEGQYFVRIVPGIGDTHWDTNVDVKPGTGT
ncbi:carboxypeptidase-like regulatory domain-containing protein, partial [Collinsella aerofaciens]